jgi:hypothetical protein
MAIRVFVKIKEGWLYQSREIQDEFDIKRDTSPSKRSFSESIRSLSPSKRSTSPTTTIGRHKEWIKKYFILLCINHEDQQNTSYELHEYDNIGGTLCDIYPLKQLEIHEIKPKSKFLNFTSAFWRNKSEDTDFILTFKEVNRESSISVISIRCQNSQDRIDWMDALQFAFNSTRNAISIRKRVSVETNTTVDAVVEMKPPVISDSASHINTKKELHQSYEYIAQNIKVQY